MKTIEAIAKLGLVPLNGMLAMALFDNKELAHHWRGYAYGDQVVATVKTKYIDPYMLYYGVDNGHYVFNTKFGVAKSHYSRAEYLERLAKHKYFSIVSHKGHVIYGAFHNCETVPKLFDKIGQAVASERDSQRKRMYKWQHWFDKQMPRLMEVVPQKKVKNLVYSILNDYGFDLTRVQVTDTWNQRNKKAIAHHIHVFESKLDRSTFMMLVYEFNHTSLGTVLHEVAHSVVLTEYAGWKGPVAGHGPEYCLILAELFQRYANIPIELTVNSMREAKLKVAPIEDFFDGKKYPFYRGL